MTKQNNYVALIEQHRFIGREFLLWLWHTSEVEETNFVGAGGKPIALWLENHMTLASCDEDTRIRSATPGTTHEAKKALQKGKLPTAAKFRAVVDENEFEWSFKADEMALAGLKVPGVLKSKEDAEEALHERMTLLGDLEAHWRALFGAFLALRLSTRWETETVPKMKRWAHA